MRSENKKVLFIINKFSGTGYKSSVEGEIIRTCSNLDIEPFIEFTTRPGHATEIAKSASTMAASAVFAVGGDGTLNEVAKGLIGSSTPMGILPKGSGNGLARHLGIPVSFSKALQVIGRNKVVAMDTLYLNDQLSINVSGIGFDGHVATLFAEKTKRGLLNYTRLVLREFNRFKEFEASILIDKTELQRKAFIITFANSSQFGNNAKIAPGASVCDGLLNVSIIRKIPVLRAPSFAKQMFAGTLESSDVFEMLTCREIIVELGERVPWHVDGEAMTPTHKFIVRLNPASLHMIVPSPGLYKI